MTIIHNFLLGQIVFRYCSLSLEVVYKFLILLQNCFLLLLFQDLKQQKKLGQVWHLHRVVINQYY